MHDFDTPGANEAFTALLTLSDPAMLTAAGSADSILSHYPAAKLGVRPSIQYCTARLVEAARSVLSHSAPGETWVVTSPPRFVLPGAANLLARELTHMLGATGDAAPTLAELWLGPERDAGEATESTRLYAQAGFETRVRERSQLHRRLRPPPVAQFQRRSVLFVNDINVTGAQQHFMRQALQALGVAHIHWLYLVSVPPEIGRARPQIEYELNYSRHASFEAFADLLRQGDIEFTARCIHRLFDHEESELRGFLASLPAERQRHLVELATQEAHCQGRSAAYWEKLQRVSG